MRVGKFSSGPAGSQDARRRVVVRGIVQGVGFRPHVYALARQLGLSGCVWNTGDGVVAEVEGAPAAVEAFCKHLDVEARPLALVTGIDSQQMTPLGGTDFTIRESEHARGRTFVSPDVAICEDCLADLTDPTNRRYRHPFVTCTNCGPRFTIITGLPYDRPTTTMAGFPLVRRLRDASTTTRPTVASTPRRSAAPTAAPAAPASAGLATRCTASRGSAADAAAAGRRRRSSRSRASAATTSPATRRSPTR